MTEDEKYWRDSALDFIIGTGSVFEFADIQAYRKETVLTFHKYSLSNQIHLIRNVDSNSNIVLVSSQPELVDNYIELNFSEEFEETNNFRYYLKPDIHNKYHPFFDSTSIIQIFLSEKNFSGAIYLVWNSEFVVTEGFKLFIDICITRIREMVRLTVTSHSFDELIVKFNAVFNSVSQAIIFTDNKGKFAWLNPKAKQVLEIQHADEEISPQIVAEKMKVLRENAENSDEILAESHSLFSQPDKEIKNWHWKYPDQVFKVSSTPVSSQQIKGRLWLFEDISEIYFANKMLSWYNKQLEEVNVEIKNSVEHLSASYALITSQNEEIVSKNDHLEKINQEKDDLIGIVSHDLKTPLAQIISFLNLIESDDKTTLNDLQKSSFGKMRNIANKSLDLINDILDLSTFENNEQNSVIQVVNISEWLQSEIEDHKVLAERKHILLKSKIEDGLFAKADLNQLSRIIDNLISNAVKFSHSQTEVVISAFSQKEMVNILFADKGLGMTDSDINDLFKKFKKLSSRPTAGENSSGLGLYIVKKLIENMKGQISCESEKGIGTTFKLIIPCG